MEIKASKLVTQRRSEVTPPPARTFFFSFNLNKPAQIGRNVTDMTFNAHLKPPINKQSLKYQTQVIIQF